MAIDKQQRKRHAARPSDWIDVLSPEIISQFVGKHIAIVYKRVVASGSTFDAVLDESLRLFPDETPYLAYIPTPEEAAAEELAATGSFVPGQFSNPNQPASIRSRTVPIVSALISLTVTPAAGPVGTVVTINGGDFTEATEVLFGDTATQSFTVGPDHSLTVVVPEKAVSGIVSVVLPDDTYDSIKPFIVVKPAVDAPLEPVAELTSNNGGAYSSPTRDSKGTVPSNESKLDLPTARAIIPPGARDGTKVEATPDGSAAGVNFFVNDTTTIEPEPVVHSLSLTGGPIGTVVSLTGRNLSHVAAVQFAGVNATEWNLLSDEILRVKVPNDGYSGTLVVVTQGGRVVPAGEFDVLFPPVISSFVPNTGAVGTKVTVYGAHFEQPLSINIGGVSAIDFNLVSDSVIELSVPPTASTAPITIHTKAGSVSSELSFRFAYRPIIGQFYPTTVKSGSSLSISGENLSDVTEVLFGSIPATSFREVSSNELSVVVPPSAQAGPVVVTTLGGSATSPTSLNVLPQPVLKSFTPSSEGIGAKIMLTGSSLSGASSVTFNGVSVTKLTVISSAFVSVEVPSGATSGPIEINTPGGTVTSSTDFIVQPMPIISSVKPISGPVGAKVTLFGQNLEKVTKLFLNGRPIFGFTNESPQAIAFTLPEDAQNGLFKVVSPGGSGASVTSFTVIPLPTIMSFAPTVGPVGTVVTVTGTNLDRAISAAINGVAANITAASPEKATVFVPTDASNGPISIVTPYGYCVSAGDFTLVSSSAIKDIVPVRGVAGSRVKISGWGFKSVLRVNFGSLESPSFAINSTNAISVQVPFGAQTGPITVITNSNDSVSSKSFKVTLSVFSFEPANGKVGTTIIVSGTGFSSATAVNIGGVSSEFAVISDSSLKAFAPANCQGGQIEVVTPIGSTKSPEQYLYSAPQTADV